MRETTQEEIAWGEEGEGLERVDTDRSFGRYEICYRIGAGGMASVYLARAVGPGGFRRPVAIKRIHPHLARRPRLVSMFLDEARIAARVNHPNVCAIFDFGEMAGSYFIAMEYLVGASLGRLIASIVAYDPARLDTARWHALAARIVADAAEGLHAAHELADDRGKPLGVVHRDVSPQNVFVTFDGAVKVVDFGIALARDRLEQTETGTVKGKFGYMAPEQADGRALDRRADVFALGVCAWEMLTGRRLFRRTSAMESLKALEREEVAPPSAVRSKVPRELDRIVMRAIEREPEKRHQSARELARELEAFVRASTEATGLSDLAEFIRPLFADEHSHKSEIVQTMLLGREEAPTEIRAPARGPLEVVTDEARVGSETASLPGAPVKKPRRRWLAIALSSLALIAIAITAVALSIEEPPPQRSPSPVHREPEPIPSVEVAPPPIAPPIAEEPAPPDPPVRRARRAPVEVGHGDVNVATVGGWAEVYEGPRKLGQTPLRVRLPAGRRTLSLRPFGRLPARRVVVRVEADRLTPLVVRL